MDGERPKMILSLQNKTKKNKKVKEEGGDEIKRKREREREREKERERGRERGDKKRE